MDKGKLMDDLGNKKITPEELTEIVKKDFKLLPMIFDGVSSENKWVKNSSGKILRSISEDHPGKLYRRLNFFEKHMNGEDTILKWLAMDTIANLAAVDKQNKIDRLLKSYYEYLSDEKMVTASHAVDGLGKIARFKPRYQKEITKQLYRVKTIKRGSECRNILLGRVISAFDGYIDQMDNKTEMIDFAELEIKNTRSGTKKKAQNFVKKHGNDNKLIFRGDLN